MENDPDDKLIDLDKPVIITVRELSKMRRNEARLARLEKQTAGLRCLVEELEDVSRCQKKEIKKLVDELEKRC